ncbi:hypothetical protein RB623_18985 [Mesorhizobium sp. LHD-90]|uniref:hypothetical protein n=1 Tax=Mesorhizobium sp. LHD-90 TaxID=3071414 RepID=UPI0027E16648|nr:hypothetical protein [Mesorhizobium sp. LHD-90]MDQ6436148.1 hypothetical protein [Mesorhizobium sp. LHD-90]
MKKRAVAREASSGRFLPRDAETGQFKERAAGGFKVGPEGMVKLNAIEGIFQSSESRKMFAEFERSGASPEERRRAIVARHARKS